MILQDTLDACAGLFSRHPGLSLTDGVLRTVMDAYGSSDEPAHVFHKVALVNALYATNVFDISRLSAHISSARLSTALSKGSLAAIPTIATGHGIGTDADGGVERVFYVFATKYAHWHNGDAYPIYDSYVGWLMPRLARLFPDEQGLEQRLCANGRIKLGALGSGEPLERYRVWKQVIDGLREGLGSRNWSYKRIDQGLWLYAKGLYSGKHPEARILASWPSEVRGELEMICRSANRVTQRV